MQGLFNIHKSINVTHELRAPLVRRHGWTTTAPPAPTRPPALALPFLLPIFLLNERVSCPQETLSLYHLKTYVTFQKFLNGKVLGFCELILMCMCVYKIFKTGFENYNNSTSKFVMYWKKELDLTPLINYVCP